MVLKWKRNMTWRECLTDLGKIKFLGEARRWRVAGSRSGRISAWISHVKLTIVVYTSGTLDVTHCVERVSNKIFSQLLREGALVLSERPWAKAAAINLTTDTGTCM